MSILKSKKISSFEVIFSQFKHFVSLDIFPSKISCINVLSFSFCNISAIEFNKNDKNSWESCCCTPLNKSIY
jgi:hypothetical protein